MAYLGVSCLMQQYGADRTKAFFQADAVQAKSVTAAAEQTLGHRKQHLRRPDPRGSLTEGPGPHPGCRHPPRWTS